MEITDSVLIQPAVITRRVRIGTNLDVLKRIGLYADIVLPDQASDQVNLPGEKGEDDVGWKKRYISQLRAKVLSDAERLELPVVNPDLDPDEARKAIAVPVLTEQSEKVVKALSLVRAIKESRSGKGLTNLEFPKYVQLVKGFDRDHIAISPEGGIIDEELLALTTYYSLNSDLRFLEKIPKGFMDPNQAEASAKRASTLMRLYYAFAKIDNAYNLENHSNYRRNLDPFRAGFLSDNIEIGALVDVSVPNWMHGEDPILRPWKVANGVLLKELDGFKFPMIERLTRFVASRRLRIVKSDGRLDFDELKKFNDVAGHFRKELAGWKDHSGHDEIFDLLKEVFPFDLGFGRDQKDDRFPGFKFIGKWDGESGHERFRNVTFRSLMDAGLGKDNPETGYTENGFELHYTLEQFQRWRNEYFKDKDWEAFFREFELDAAFHNFDKSPVKVHRVLFLQNSEEIALLSGEGSDSVKSPSQNLVKNYGEFIPVEEFVLGNSGKVDETGKARVVGTSFRPTRGDDTHRRPRREAVKNQPKPPREPRVRVVREPRQPKVRIPKPPREPREPRAKVFCPPRPRKVREPKESKAPITVEARALKVADKAKAKMQEISNAALESIAEIKKNKPNEIDQIKDVISNILNIEPEAVAVPEVVPAETPDAETLSKKIEEVEKKIEEVEDAKDSAEKIANEARRAIDRSLRKLSGAVSVLASRVDEQEKILKPEDLALADAECAEPAPVVSPERTSTLEQVRVVKNEITQTETRVKTTADEAKEKINGALNEISMQASSALESLGQALKELEDKESEADRAAKQLERDTARNQRQKERDALKRSKEAERNSRDNKAQALREIRSAKSQAKKDIDSAKSTSIKKSKSALRTIEKIKTNPKTYEQAKKIANAAKAKIAGVSEKALGVINPLRGSVLDEIIARRVSIIGVLEKVSGGMSTSGEIEAAIGGINKAEDECKRISAEAIAKIDKELGAVKPKISLQIDVVNAEEGKVNSAKSAIEAVVNDAEGTARSKAEASNATIDTADKNIKDLIEAKRGIIQENLPEPIEGIDGIKSEISAELEKVTTKVATLKLEISSHHESVAHEVQSVKDEVNQVSTSVNSSANGSKEVIDKALSEVLSDATTIKSALNGVLNVVKKKEVAERKAIEAVAEKAGALIAVIDSPFRVKELPACKLGNDSDSIPLPSIFKSGNMELICKATDAFVIGSQKPLDSSLESLLISRSPGGGNDYVLSNEDIKKLLNTIGRNIDDFDNVGLSESAKAAFLGALKPLISSKEDVRNILLAALSVSKKVKLPENTDSVQVLDTFIKYIIGNAAIKAIEDKAARRKRVNSSTPTGSLNAEVAQRADRLKTELEKHWNGIYLPFRGPCSNEREAYSDAISALSMFNVLGRVKSQFYSGVEMVSDEQLLREHVARVVKAKYDAQFNKKASIEKTFMESDLFERDVEYVRKKYGLEVNEEVSMIALGKCMEEGKNITLLPEGLINPNDGKFALRVSVLWKYAVGS